MMLHAAQHNAKRYLSMSINVSPWCRAFALAVALGCSINALAASPADPNKVIRIAFPAGDDGFDLATTTNSLYSNWVAEAIFETLLTYDYLARPARLVPSTAKSMPEVSDDGKTYLFRIKPGILFSDDRAFKGSRRELTAADYAYSIKRILDPKSRTPQSSAFTGKIVGMDELIEEAKKNGRFDYDKPLAGLETPDRYTLRIRLTAPDHTFLYLMAHPSTGAVAREVIEFYKQDIGRHPVGTGPYKLSRYVPRSKIVLEANPDYRGFTWDFQPSGDAWDDQLVKDMRGKKMPQVGRVEISIIEESQSSWLAFDSGQLDYMEANDVANEQAMDRDKLKPEYAKRGLGLLRNIDPVIMYTMFSMKDPIVGGLSKEKIALRRAIAMSFDINDEITLLRKGHAVKAQSILPPGVIGHNPEYISSIPYSPAAANMLLDRFGYRKGADGYRTLPDGKPLTLKFHSSGSARDIARSELWKRSLDRVGLRVDFPVSSFGDNLKAAYECKLMIWALGGSASIPDGIDFFESLYGPNIGKGNKTCYDSPAFNDMYRRLRDLPDGPERNMLFNKMSRQLEFDMVEFPGIWRISNYLVQPWVQGFKKHPIMRADWHYLDIKK